MACSTVLLRFSAVLLVVAAIVRPGDGLQCYQCTSDIDADCQSHPKKTAKCDDIADIGSITGGVLDVKPVCLKAIIKDNESGKTMVMRSCIVETSLVKTCDIAGKLNIPKTGEIKFCGTCETDLCNTSSRLVISFWPLLISCIITLILSNIH